MTRKIWRLLCILSVFLAGMLLFEGGILLLRYGARQEGLYADFAGGCAALFFLTAFVRAFGKDREKEYKIWKMALAEGSAALVSIGVTFYVYRYQEMAVQLRTAGIVLCAVLVFVWQSLFSRKSRRLQEEQMKETLRKLFLECREQNQITKEDQIDEQVQRTLLLKMQIWELRWCLGLLAAGLIAGLAANFRGDWQIWALGLVVAAGFAWLCGRDGIHTARILSELVEKGQSQEITAFFLCYYTRAKRRWESMTPTLQIYLPISLCQTGEYDKALELLRCMKKRPEEEVYYLVWEAEALKAKEDWEALKETLESLRKAIPHLPKAGRAEMEEKYQAYERIWKEKGE